MTIGYFPTGPDAVILRAMAAAFRGRPANAAGQLSQGPSLGMEPIIQLGVAYGTIPAASYSAGGMLIAPGVGEAKFHRLLKSGAAMDTLDELPTKVYSIVTVPIVDGQEALFVRDGSIHDPDAPYTANEGYIAIRTDPGGSSEPERHFYLCGGDSKAVVDSDTLTELYLGDYANFDTSTYEVNAGEYSISLKRVGYYTLRHDWILECTTSGEVDSKSQATVWARVGDNVVVADRATVACTHIPLTVINAGPKAGKTLAGCTYYVQAVNASAPYTRISFAMKRDTYLASSLVYLRSAMLRYFGTTAPTLGAFTDPSP